MEVIRTTGHAISATTPNANLGTEGGLVAFDWADAAVPTFDRVVDLSSEWSLEAEIRSPLLVPTTVTVVTASVVIRVPHEGLIPSRGLKPSHVDYAANGLYFAHDGTWVPLDIMPPFSGNAPPQGGYGDYLTIGFGGTHAFLSNGGAIEGTVKFVLGMESVTFGGITTLQQASWEGTVAYYTGYNNG